MARLDKLGEKRTSLDATDWRTAQGLSASMLRETPWSWNEDKPRCQMSEELGSEGNMVESKSNSLTKGVALPKILSLSPKEMQMRRRRNKKRKLTQQDKINFAKRLNENLPQSEKWFWSEWNRMEMKHDLDIPNEPFCGFIPDVVNHKYKYIIEIDGDVHFRKSVANRDKTKNMVYGKSGYFLFRIDAYNDIHLDILADEISKIRNQADWKPKYKKTILRKFKP